MPQEQIQGLAGQEQGLAGQEQGVVGGEQGVVGGEQGVVGGEQGGEDTTLKWTINVKTNTSMRDNESIYRKTLSPGDFIIDIPLNKSQFRQLFEDTNTTSTGTLYSHEALLGRMKNFFESTNTKRNNELFSTDMYQMIIATFSDLDVKVSKLNESCSSNLISDPNDSSKNNLVYNYVTGAETTTMDENGQVLNVVQAIAHRFEYMTETYDNTSPFYYSKFWDNSVSGNAIILEGSIQTPSQQYVNVDNTYTHAGSSSSKPGWSPWSIKFVQSDENFGYQ